MTSDSHDLSWAITVSNGDVIAFPNLIKVDLGAPNHTFLINLHGAGSHVRRYKPQGVRFAMSSHRGQN